MPKTLRTQGLLVLAGENRGAEEKKAASFNTVWLCGCPEELFEATRLLSDHLQPNCLKPNAQIEVRPIY